jgi:hypothetical protein
MLEVAGRGGGTCEVEDPGKLFVHLDRFTDILLDQKKTGMILKVKEVIATSCDKVIHPYNPVTLLEEGIHQVTAYEPSCSCNEGGGILTGKARH